MVALWLPFGCSFELRREGSHQKDAPGVFVSLPCQVPVTGDVSVVAATDLAACRSLGIHPEVSEDMAMSLKHSKKR